MLSFISFWRAAAIVLSDLASSAFYAGGIAEHAIGASAPWFILGVMLFSFAVRSIYLESSSMFVRGGVYVVVREAMGTFMARLSVSALLFDYILTGPISCVSAGQYLAGVMNELADMWHAAFHVPANSFSAAFGIMVTGYFWWSNIKGIHESSAQGAADSADHHGHGGDVSHLVPHHLSSAARRRFRRRPCPANLHFSNEGLGWFKGTFWPTYRSSLFSSPSAIRCCR